MNLNPRLSEHEALVVVQAFQRLAQEYKQGDSLTASLSLAIKDTYVMLRELVLEQSELELEQELELGEV